MSAPQSPQLTPAQGTGPNPSRTSTLHLAHVHHRKQVFAYRDASGPCSINDRMHSRS
ncbi:hypothetical protein BV25DRAFT_1821190 [Artomyces pyxidatus]|uniref:Uncharacterized protein n=1 Tax=Artomyces pyxidatus TaxID=48021 RepID=A0ACB8TCE7_9AGAM|nr:hypothetical protein BV25DRAFT_1821190 [Artomyces pyxidatus]